MTSALGLTPRQRDALAYIADYTNSRGYSPSYLEIGAALGLGSKSGVHRLIIQLEGRGHIRRDPNRCRSIDVATGVRDVALGLELDADLCAAARDLGISPESLIARAVEVYLREARA